MAKPSSSFEEHAFSVFSESPSHVGAPALLECLSHASAAEDGTLILDQFPAASALTEDEREWVRRTLVACGFELQADGSLAATTEVLDQLRKEQNTARKRAHAEAAAAREKLLSNALRDLEQQAAKAVASAGPREVTLAQARAALSKFLLAFNGQPAVGPLLLGLGALLRAQANSPEQAGKCWLVDRATLLNGGDEFVRQAVPLLGMCGVRPGAGAALAEAGDGAADDEVALRVVDGAWTLGEMGALGVLLERKSRGGAYGARAGGRLVDTGETWGARQTASLGEWMSALLSAWLTRLAP